MSQHAIHFAIEAAIREAQVRRQEYVTVEHLLFALLFEEVASDILANCGGDLDELQQELEDFLDSEVPTLPPDMEGDPKQTLGFRRVLERAILQVRSSGKSHIDGGDVLVAIHGESDSHAAYLLEKHGASRLNLVNFISHGISPIDRERKEAKEEDDEREESYGEDRPLRKPLSKFTINLTELARLGKLDPLIGREDELKRIMQVLCRRTKNNPMLVGDAGVGKTAIVAGLAQRIIQGKVPDLLKESDIYTLDLGSLLAGTKFRGQFEERLKGSLDALRKKKKAILFIDEIHMIMGAGSASGSSMDVSNMLKPALQSGDIRCIGATTHEDYRSHLERDRALIRRFQKIDIHEPSIDDTVKILQGLRARYERFHGVRYEPSALESAAELSSRYITERHLPDKAIDVIDEAGALNHLRGREDRRRILVKADVEEVVSRIARIPDLNAKKGERERLLSLEEEMKAVVFGQDNAIEALVAAVKLSRAGLGHPDQPVGSFLFVGPTGVGKTEVARQIARVMGIGFVRFDMSEYMEKHAVSRLIGAPPGYVGFDQGGLLTSAIRKTPHCVLLLDEIEKAHVELFDILLQVMDRASLTDNTGRQADFHNVTLIMTSNAGTREMSQRSIGFAGAADIRSGMKEVERLFSPEFRNRLTEVVTFSRLSAQVMESIVDKFVHELEQQLTNRSITITLSPEARTWLAEKGYDEIYGARPLNRLIQNELRRPLADEILFGKLEEGGDVIVGLDGSKLTFAYEPLKRSSNPKPRAREQLKQ